MNPISFEHLHTFNHALSQLEQYLRDEGTKRPLISIIEATPEGINVQTVMDVSYESYSIRVNFPTPVLEIVYTGVKHRIVGDRFFDVGPMSVRLELAKYGRVLFEKVIVTQIDKIEYLQQIDVHI